MLQNGVQIFYEAHSEQLWPLEEQGRLSVNRIPVNMLDKRVDEPDSGASYDPGPSDFRANTRTRLSCRGGRPA